ncbi:MAG: NAD-dependent epimerase/dehydratase family protein [Nanoarchaeota archaeon]
MEIKDKKFIITGGAGFLGKHVVSLLINKYKVKEANIFIPRSVEYDLRKEKDIDILFKKFKPEIVIHLATVSGGLGYYKEHPAKVFHDILSMGTNMLEASRLSGVKTFIMTGSATIYPAKAEPPYKEEDIWNGLPDESEISFGLSNRALSSEILLYRKEYGFDGRFFILSSLYGPGYNFNLTHPHVIPSLIKRFDNIISKKEDKIEIWGTGKALRDFIYVEDAAEAIILALREYNSSEPLNISSGEGTSIKDITERIAKIMKFKGKIVPDLTKPEGRLNRIVSAEKLEKYIKFKGKTDLENGLKNTIKDYLNSKK